MRCVVEMIGVTHPEVPSLLHRLHICSVLKQATLPADKESMPSWDDLYSKMRQTEKKFLLSYQDNPSV